MDLKSWRRYRIALRVAVGCEWVEARRMLQGHCLLSYRATLAALADGCSYRLLTSIVHCDWRSGCSWMMGGVFDEGKEEGEWLVIYLE